jgi:hypothetical protein
MTEGDAPMRASTDQQDEVARLIEQAKRQPGVADALAAYARIAPYVPAPPSVRSTTRYALGGNR